MYAFLFQPKFTAPDGFRTFDEKGLCVSRSDLEMRYFLELFLARWHFDALVSTVTEIQINRIPHISPELSVFLFTYTLFLYRMMTANMTAFAAKRQTITITGTTTSDM